MKTALITGASGGIGSATALALARDGYRLLLTGRDQDRLEEVAQRCGARAHWIIADLTRAHDREEIVAASGELAVDTVINCAGTNELIAFEQMDDAAIAAMIAANVTAPITLTHALLPQLRARPAAQIVNVGSTFGTIGFPGYVAYSTTKFALRGFSEALRRELADSSIQVKYIAPRATRTALNSSRADALNRDLGNAVDQPETVAAAIAAILERGPGDYYLGWPEKLFARLNAFMPGLVSRALRPQLGTIRRYADNDVTGAANPAPDS